MLRGAVLLAAASVAAAQGHGAVPVTDEAYKMRPCRPGFDQFAFCNTTLSKAERVDALIGLLKDDEIPALLTAREGGGGSPGPPGNISRLGLPAYDWGLNCIHGVQSSCVKDSNGEIYCPTSFPNPVNLGASWNDSMWKTMGYVIGKEARALFVAGATEWSNWSDRPHIGLDCWSPNININHDPRWGRNQEVPSEDPILNGIFGAAITKGQQFSSDDPKYVMSIATIKHWDAYSLEDSDGFTRHNFDATLNNYTFSDTFFPAWRRTVKDAGALGVMCSYNAVNGQPTCANEFLHDVLRNTFEFSGYVSSDTGAVQDIYDQHHFVKTPQEAACVAIKAQTDIDSGKVYHDALLSGVQQGLCTMDDVKQALRNTFGLLFDMGLFDPVDNQPYWNYNVDVIGMEHHQAAAKQAAKESMVLLKNNNTLPLAKGKKIAVIGPHYNSTQMMVGNYYGQICKDNTFNCVETIYNAIKRYNQGGSTTAAQGCSITGSSTNGFPAAMSLVEEADIVVLAIGIDESVEAESHDRTAIDLPGVQQQLVSQVLAKANSMGKKTAMVMMNGGMVALGSLPSTSGALLEAFYPSIYGGDAIASTLFGENTMLGGKMPYTVYPADYINEITMDKMSMNDVQTPGRSYKYYTGPTEFDFGFGLSFTTFELAVVTAPSSMSCESTATATVAIKVTNTGKVEGDEVVQLFRKGGTGGTNGIPVAKQLVAFKRVHLSPGASTTVTFSISRADFADVMDNGNRVCSPATRDLIASNGNDQVLTIPFSTTGSTATVAVFPMV
eukprot:TRINITY_DN4791_c3_g1_i1.p1 TRINITY_DN4791_c3_g1~~TRINITY_DN4791_c3_g1_i1.p1  ORF type:complete len:803 (+),score=275.66 TRINITY_DN4791_c3_g1_i1:68-2410(+)